MSNKTKTFFATTSSVMFMLLFLILFTETNVQAQHFTKRKRYLSLGVEFNNNLFKGDVFTNGQHFRPGVAGNIQYKITPRASLVLNAGFHSMIGSDLNAPEDSPIHLRGYQFYSGNYFADAMARIDLWDNRSTYRRRFTNNFYALAGAGFIKVNSEYYTPTVTGAQSSKDNYCSVILGVGYVHKLNRRWDAFFEYRSRIFLSDNVDFLKLNSLDKARTVAFGVRRIMQRSGGCPRFR